MVKNPTKRQRKNKPTSKKYKFYKIDGDKITRERSCPRCGLGVFLMKADNRVYCGRCHLTEFFSKKDISKKIEGSDKSESVTEKPKEEKKE